MLREVGFWCSLEAMAGAEELSGDRPNPLELVNEAWFASLPSDAVTKLQWYLTRGAFVESHELAYSFCRFPDCSVAHGYPRVMGACTMTDGVYCWPEGYWHYVAHHHVKPPTEFLAHVQAQHDELAKVTKPAAAQQKLLLWDEVEKQPVFMPHAMQEWITSYTTIQLDP